MGQTNIKVSKIVHEELSQRKQPGETFDDVLKRELGLLPSLDDLIAYFPEDLANMAKNITHFVERLEDLETKTTEDTWHNIEFIAPKSKRTIARIQFSEESFNVEYRNQHGKMSGATNWIHSKKARDMDDENMNRLKERLRNKIKGAYKRWG